MRDTIVKEVIDLYSDGGWYAKTYAKYKSPLFELSGIIKYLPENGTIIELGCGPGLISNYISLRLQNVKIIGMDLNKKKDRNCTADHKKQKEY